MSDPAPARWDDLLPRVLSALVMALIGVLAIWGGGYWFAGLVAVITGALLWEIRAMTSADEVLSALLPAILGAGLVLLVPVRAEVELFVAALFLVGAVTAGAQRMHVFTAILALGVLLAGYGLVEFRYTHGGTWLFWLLLVVIVTDIMGYFAGRVLGGPKFWPALSPKKTWSGTVAGWIGAAGVGGLFISFTKAGWDLLWISMLLSLASQLGDITESAFKRRAGVKDSSALIPGHGGVFDRFDGALGAALFMLVVALVVDVPEVRL